VSNMVTDFVWLNNNTGVLESPTYFPMYFV